MGSGYLDCTQMCCTTYCIVNRKAEAGHMIVAEYRVMICELEELRKSISPFLLSEGERSFASAK